MRLKLANGTVVLAADASFFRRTLRERRLPRYIDDRDSLLASLDRLQALEQGGARILFGHDPDCWNIPPQKDDNIEY